MSFIINMGYKILACEMRVYIAQDLAIPTTIATTKLL